MQTTIHIFHKPEEALAFKAGVDTVYDEMIRTELGPGPAEVTIHDDGPDYGTPPEWHDHRLQIDAPDVSDTPPAW